MRPTRVSLQPAGPRQQPCASRHQYRAGLPEGQEHGARPAAGRVRRGSGRSQPLLRDPRPGGQGHDV